MFIDSGSFIPNVYVSRHLYIFIPCWRAILFDCYIYSYTVHRFPQFIFLYVLQLIYIIKNYKICTYSFIPFVFCLKIYLLQTVQQRGYTCTYYIFHGQSKTRSQYQDTCILNRLIIVMVPQCKPSRFTQLSIKCGRCIWQQLKIKKRIEVQ